MSLVTAAAFCAATSLCQATVYFQNTGTTSGWSGSNLDSGCSVANSTSVVYRGSTSFKCRTLWEGASHRYHAMKVYNSGYNLGQMRFYGFAFYLQSAWDFSGSQQYQLFQFIANYSDQGCDDWQPSTMIWISGNQLATRRNYGSSSCSRSVQSYTGLATVSRGVWNRIILQASWKADTTGYLKLWLNGSKVFERYNIATTINSTRTYRMDVGLYSNSWYDQKTVVGSGDRQLWIDNVRIASTYGEADPAQW